MSLPPVTIGRQLRSLAGPRSARTGGASGAILVAALLLLASAQFPHGGAAQRSLAAAPRPSATASSSPLIGAAASNPIYDEQLGATFTQNLSSLTFNVTALAQTDADGYGPAYILNGLTSAGYWYQVGISYHWPSSSGSYDPSFGFSYQVYGPNDKPVYPANGGAGLGSFSKVVHSGDSVLLSLTFVGTTVQMLAQDWITGATAKASYSSVGASTFVGNPSRPASSQGFFTGLMTEWYHVSLFTGNEGKVTYTDEAVALSSAWLWDDEFDTSSSGTTVFINQTQTPVSFSNDQQVYPFASNGITIYGSAHQFITGLLNTASSRVTLTPAFAEAASPSFVASYTLAGLQQTADVAAGPGTMIEADPGTTIALAVNASDVGTFDRWVFDGASGTEVSFPAGTNATYVYYHLVQENLSVQVVSPGASLPSYPTLSYEVPWPTPVSSPTQLTATQVLGPTPVAIFALLGSNASITGTIAGAGQLDSYRWATIAQNWTISGPGVIPSPIQYYQQYQVTAAYNVVGGGTPPQIPEFTSTAFGSPTTLQISGPFVIPSCPQTGCSSFPAGMKTGWFDVGSGYSFTSVLNGSTPAERWTGSEAKGSPPFSPDAVLTEDYTHQYHVGLGVNDQSGGSTSSGSGWLDSGSVFNSTASASQGWQFEGWDGSGAGAYTGTSPSIDVNVTSPLTENATFYVRLTVSADSRTDIAYSFNPDPSCFVFLKVIFGSCSVESGLVQPGTSENLYVLLAAT